MTGGGVQSVEGPAGWKWTTLSRSVRGVTVWDLANLRALCRGCHFHKTGRENRTRKPVPAEVRAWSEFVIDQF